MEYECSGVDRGDVFNYLPERRFFEPLTARYFASQPHDDLFGNVPALACSLALLEVGRAQPPGHAVVFSVDVGFPTSSTDDHARKNMMLFALGRSTFC